ncbi:MAG: polysaccharide pyruvyl transferase CsaB, partial [Cyanobium sp. MAG_237]|nr:polysaccharide pyruvyl transferase CsaB [Cyanobium sp. MAG_237]
APCAALSYDPKVDAAAANLGCPCHSLDAPPSPAMLAGWDGALDTPPPASRLLELRQQSEVHQQVFACLEPRAGL